MEGTRLKRGRIEKIEDKKVTILNQDGQCRDTVAVFPQVAEEIESKIGPGREVFYVLQ